MNASKKFGIFIQKIVSKLQDPDLDFFTHPGSGSGTSSTYTYSNSKNNCFPHIKGPPAYDI